MIDSSDNKELWIKFLKNMYDDSKVDTLEMIIEDMLEALKELRENSDSVVVQKKADFMIEYVGGFMELIDE